MNKYTKFITSLLIALGTTTVYGSASSNPNPSGAGAGSGSVSGTGSTGATGAGAKSAGSGADPSSTLNNSTQNISTDSNKPNASDTTSNVSATSGDGVLNTNTDDRSSSERYTEDSDPVSYDGDDVDHDGGNEVYPSTADEY